jgi:hypothetical protein
MDIYSFFRPEARHPTKGQPVRQLEVGKTQL